MTSGGYTSPARTILALAAIIAAGSRAFAADSVRPAGSDTIVFADAGYGQADYDFIERPVYFERRFFDAEFGMLRELRPGSPFRVGGGIGLLAPVDRPLRDSYSLLCVDALTAEFAPRVPVRIRLGLGLLRAFAPVNELALGAMVSAAADLGPVAVGIKGRGARFEVDFEPHADPPPQGGNTKCDVFYVGVFVSRAFDRM